jgi:chromosome segregation ATPase
LIDDLSADAADKDEASMKANIESQQQLVEMQAMIKGALSEKEIENAATVQTLRCELEQKQASHDGQTTELEARLADRETALSSLRSELEQTETDLHQELQEVHACLKRAEVGVEEKEADNKALKEALVNLESMLSTLSQEKTQVQAVQTDTHAHTDAHEPSSSVPLTSSASYPTIAPIASIAPIAVPPTILTSAAALFFGSETPTDMSDRDMSDNQLDLKERLADR